MNLATGNLAPRTEQSKPRTGPFLSLGVNMEGRRCLVVGGGRIGERKISSLFQSGAEVIVVSPRVSDEVRRLASAGEIDWRKQPYHPDDLTNVFLVVAATSDADLNTTIGRAARRRGILVCVVSSSEDSDVLFPAVLQEPHADLTVAVHSHGRDCRRSKRVRDALRQWFFTHECRSERVPKDDDPVVDPNKKTSADSLTSNEVSQ